MKERPKLRTYITLKHKLEREKYLELRDRYGAPELTKLRGGLRIESGRYQKIPRELRLCEVCTRGEVEDESHFMLDCSLYDDLREEMWSTLERWMGFKREDLSKEKQLNALIGDEFAENEFYDGILKTAMQYIKQAMKRRQSRQDVMSRSMDASTLVR